MNQELISLPIPSNCLYKLLSGGFVTIGDFVNITTTELVDEVQITNREAEDILSLVEKEKQNGGKNCQEIHKKDDNKNLELESISAYDLFIEEASELNIVTFCAALDDALGGGIPLRKITEICGPPGVGKTQIGIQLAVDVQIPKIFGGVGGEAVYIDTEGGFTIERLTDIAQETVLHIKNVAEEEKDAALLGVSRTFSVDSILKGVHVYRCHDPVQLLAVSRLLPTYLQQVQKVKLIILDSVASHFRHEFDDLAQRSRVLQGMVQIFAKLAWENKMAVVFMNQMTTKISRDQLKEAHLVPALGESWGHSCAIRIILSWENGRRLAHLVKSPHRKNSVVPYDITEHGIRDTQSDENASNIEEEQLRDQHSASRLPLEKQSINKEQLPDAKRPRIL